MDTYSGGHSLVYWQVQWRVPPGERKRQRLRTGERESRYRQRKISSVNQAWLTASYSRDWWQFSTGATPAPHFHLNVKIFLMPPPRNSHTRQSVLIWHEQGARSHQARPQSAILYVWAGCHKNYSSFYWALTLPPIFSEWVCSPVWHIHLLSARAKLWQARRQKAVISLLPSVIQGQGVSEIPAKKPPSR